MSLFSRVYHHYHVRKRVHQNLEPYPHPDKWKNLLDRMIVFIGISAPIMTIPQLFEIWANKSAESVSLISWSWYLVAAVVWLIYGIVHKEKPLIVTYVGWIVIDILIVAGILIYS